MDKRFVVILLVVGFVFVSGGKPVYSSTGNLSFQSKLDPFLQYLVDANRNSLETTGKPLQLQPFASSLEVYSGGHLYFSSLGPSGEKTGLRSIPTDVKEEAVGVLIKVKGKATFFDLPGVYVNSTVGPVATARVSLSDLPRLARNEQVVYVARSNFVKPSLDLSVPAVGADTLHSRQPIDKGENVLIGIVDTGIDYDHLDFRTDSSDEDDEEEESRILYIWDQTDGFASPPSQFSYGTEYSKTQIEQDIASQSGPDSGQVRESDVVGHGSHVAGIAAGDGSSSPVGYVGVAPEASIICVKTLFTTTAVIDAIHYIHQKADVLGMPVVTNLSLGTQVGPHDGSSLFEEAVNDLISSDKLITVSAGNSGDEKVHFDLSVPGETTGFGFQIPGYSPASNVADYVELDGYYDGAGELSFRVIDPSGKATSWVEKGQRVQFDFPSGTILISNGPSGVNEDNRIFIRVGEFTNTPPQEGVWRIEVRGTPGTRLDMWIADSLLGEGSYPVEFLDGNSSMTIAEPGNAEKVLTVGSFNTKNNWDSTLMSGYPLRQLSSFSSMGPTRDGRVKPDLAAPGAWVVSTLSGSSSPPSEYLAADDKHRSMAGTSVAVPHATGAAALMWHAAPELTAGEIKSRLKETAHVETSVPDSTWGWGKINVEKAVFSTGVPQVETENDLWIKGTPNPASEEINFFYSIPEGSENPRILIYNVVGKVLKTIPTQDIRGRMKYEWDLRDDRGKRLANGLYIYFLVTQNNRTKLNRLVIRR